MFYVKAFMCIGGYTWYYRPGLCVSVCVYLILAGWLYHDSITAIINEHSTLHVASYSPVNITDRNPHSSVDTDRSVIRIQCIWHCAKL